MYESKKNEERGWVNNVRPCLASMCGFLVLYLVPGTVLLLVDIHQAQCPFWFFIQLTYRKKTYILWLICRLNITRRIRYTPEYYVVLQQEE